MWNNWEPAALLGVVSSLLLTTKADYTIKWSNCSSTAAPRLECGSLDVPINWNDPNGSLTTIGFQRLKASNATARIGPLFFNPGGPGGVASEFITATAQGDPVLGEKLNEYFDLIGPDPRGMGTSTPIRCDPDLWNKRVPVFPKTESEWQELVAYNEELGNSCRNLTGLLFEHVDTLSVAKDFEAVRVALGGEKLNFLGLSYGTQLGATYAELYPQNIRAMVLDGNMDHSQSETSSLVDESSTYETVLGRFAEWCTRNSTCALYERDVLQIFDDLVTTATKSPISAPACKVSGACYLNVTGDEIRINAQNYLLFEEGDATFGLPGWATLGIALNDSLNGNASMLSTALATDETDSNFPGRAVLCLDWTHDTKSLSELLYKEQLGKTISPHTQGATQTWGIQTNCIGWPAPVQYPPRYYDENIKNAPPILMVNALYDPSTSIVWANGALAQIPSATLLVRNGNGHTSYLLFGEATSAMQHYLITLERPAPNSIVNS
jgi:pimeloyl-ACP methyl ester carboxylesterase